MSNENKKIDYQIFCHSRFHEHSTLLSFSNSAGMADNVIVLVMTVAGEYN